MVGTTQRINVTIKNKAGVDLVAPFSREGIKKKPLCTDSWQDYLFLAQSPGDLDIFSMMAWIRI